MEGTTGYILWGAVSKATHRKRTARNTSMTQLFGDARCIAAILEFLEATEGGRRGQAAWHTAGEEDVETEGAEVENAEAKGAEAEGAEAVFDPGGRAVERVL
jgi:hypothetical protein